MATVSYGDLIKSYEDSGEELCPVGTYDVKVAEAKFSPTSTGRDQFIVVYEILTGPYAGRKVKNWMTIVSEYPGLVKRWFDQMEAMGLNRDYFRAEPPNDRVCADLTGRTCRIEVGRRKKKGSSDEETEDISKVMPLDAAAVPMTADPMRMVAPAADATAPAVPF